MGLTLPLFWFLLTLCGFACLVWVFLVVAVCGCESMAAHSLAVPSYGDLIAPSGLMRFISSLWFGDAACYNKHSMNGMYTTISFVVM